MKVFLISFLILTNSWFAHAKAAPNPAANNAKVTVLAVISDLPRADYEAKMAPFLKEQLGKCSSCEAKNLTPYNEKGELDRAALPAAIEGVIGNAQILYFGWNETAGKSNEAWLESLKKVTREGVLLVGTAGEAHGEAPSHSLARTVLGQVPDAVIIGELNEKESLVRKSFYGPEMLTAIKSPKDETLADGIAPSLFALRLAREWNKKSQAEWMSHFRARKSHSKRIWPGIDEFFNR